jgi:hypothetical protein
MTTKIFDFEFLVPVQRDHVVVVTRVEHGPTKTSAVLVVDQTANVTYCSDALYQTLWSDDAALEDPLALLARQGWKVHGSQMGRVVSVLMVTRDEGDANFLRTRIMTAPVAAGDPYR